ncbi:L-glutamine:2-deoxy-scyllo-inosose/3-amino-2,3-dideoxy-scyllo-inosose aminotransferase [Lentzea atacamensis]|uniref:L-glutamine:2-deoxy-scyllo-inosose/3-amino-2, 3-dideoxy-scyllo-inosose aminotransferase n=2 Tax=Lentzea atacamensis TaxID=531938 RepID=A0A316HKX4_9PSEU|nr:L-glutamine:2-deoxy-scyllo-inosose/3-amino-2,3-dideoxy-scyllo-inosose aminotransferase [Lentzea atacamensis]
MFADYLDVRHCVPVDHGSSALVIAMEALGLEHGTPVLVPALTWVAPATAAFRAGLLPVLVDVDPDTGIVGPDAVDPAVGAGAVVAVHLACVMADVPSITAVAQQHGMAVVEDAAQAHGARWLGQAAGSMGRLGCFSMQQSKVLTGAEGGAVVTDDADLAAVLEELRADSRRYPGEPIGGGRLELVESATSMGANFCMNEFSAAILCAQFDDLEAQHVTRNTNYRRLTELLADVDGVRVLQPRAEQTQTSIYQGGIVFDPLPATMPNDRVAEALTAELGVLFFPPREPLHRSRLLRPWMKPSLGPVAERFRQQHLDRRYPHAEYFARHAVLTHHSTFLGDEQDMADIATAVRKVVTAGFGR